MSQILCHSPEEDDLFTRFGSSASGTVKINHKTRRCALFFFLYIFPTWQICINNRYRKKIVDLAMNDVTTRES